MQGQRRRRVESSEKLLARAVDLILCGGIGRGLRLIDRNGLSLRGSSSSRTNEEALYLGQMWGQVTVNILRNQPHDRGNSASDLTTGSVCCNAPSGRCFATYLPLGQIFTHLRICDNCSFQDISIFSSSHHMFFFSGIH